MMEEVDFEIVIGVVFVLLAIWLIIRRQNRKDKDDLEDHIKNSDLKKDKHDNPHV
jgi:preprotein translocase subunit YajC